MLKSFNRPKPVAWAFFIAAFGLTLALGTWQVKRLEWKLGVIEALAEANKQAPVAALPTDEAELKALQFHKISLKGRWLGDIEFHIAPRYLHDKFGYWIVTPLVLKDGRTLLVNRGWVPGDKKLASTRPETAVKGNATITGLVRIGPERNYFTPASQPLKNVWFGRDTEQMAAFAELKNVVPAMVDIVGEQDLKKLPVPSDGIIRVRNDHVSYIITWYGIALGILVIFLVYHRKKA